MARTSPTEQYDRRRDEIIEQLDVVDWLRTDEVAEDLPWSTLTVFHVLASLADTLEVERRGGGAPGVHVEWRLLP